MITILDLEVSDRVLVVFDEQGLSGDDISHYSRQQLEDIHGIGPKMAGEILDAIAAHHQAESAQPKPDGAQAALDHAYALLTGCGRGQDVANLKYQATREPAAAVVESAIAILEGLQGGDRGKNLAADVRAML